MSKVQILKIYFNAPVSPEREGKRLIDDLIELFESHGLTFAAFFGEEEVEEEADNEQPS